MFPIYTPDYVASQLDARYHSRAGRPAGSIAVLIRSLRRERRADRGLPVSR